MPIRTSSGGISYVLCTKRNAMNTTSPPLGRRSTAAGSRLRVLRQLEALVGLVGFHIDLTWLRRIFA
jgi:hypothetical protein